MKLKMIVGIALISFILIAGNIIVFGLLQPDNVTGWTINKNGNALKNITDNSTLEVKNDSVVQPVTTTQNKTQNTTQTIVVTPKPTPKPAPTPVRTRAS